jgi:transposase
VGETEREYERGGKRRAVGDRRAITASEAVWIESGRPRIPDRSALEGIVYVLRSGIPWRMLPKEFGCSGVTCCRRLRDWRKAGLFERLHRTLLDRLSKAGRIDFSRANLDSASIPAKKGERKPEPTH